MSRQNCTRAIQREVHEGLENCTRAILLKGGLHE